MSLTIQFLININSAQSSLIVSQLKSIGLAVNSLSDFGSNTPIPNQLFCSKEFFDWPQVINEQNNMNNIEGIKKIIVFRHQERKERQIWYRHWAIPILISTVVNAVGIILIIYELKPTAVITDYLVLTIIPAILSFFGAVGVKLAP